MSWARKRRREMAETLVPRVILGVHARGFFTRLRIMWHSCLHVGIGAMQGGPLIVSPRARHRSNVPELGAGRRLL